MASFQEKEIFGVLLIAFLLKWNANKRRSEDFRLQRFIPIKKTRSVLRMLGTRSMLRLGVPNLGAIHTQY